MRTTTLLFIRHGDHAHGGRFWQHGCPGVTDLGHRQAQATAAALVAAGAADGVVSSLSPRAFQTADVIAEAFNLTARRTCDLCEMHPGEAEGLTVDEMNAAFGPHYGFVPGAEYHPDWLPGAIARIHELADAATGQRMVFVTHTAVLRASVIALGGADLVDADSVRFGNCSITEWSGSGDTWRLERLNDLDHLVGVHGMTPDRPGHDQP